MNRVFINDKEIDVYVKDANSVISITKQVNEIGELRNSQAHHSNKFKLPFTERNKRVFEGFGLVGGKSRTPYKKLKATYVDDGEPMLQNGYGIINKLDSDYYLTIYDGNIFLFEALGNKKMSDLDLSYLDHDLTEANFVNSFDNTDGYIYAISDYGNFDPAHIVINYQLPSFYVHTLLSKIFEEAGVTVQGEIFTDAKHKELIITPKRGYDSEIDAISEVWSDSATVQDRSATDYKTAEWTDIYYNPSILLGLLPNGSHLTDNTINITETGNYHVNIDITGTNKVGATSVKIIAHNMTTGTYIATHETTITGGTYAGVLDEIVYANTGDVLFFTVLMFGDWGSDTTATVTVDNGGNFLFETTADVSVRVVASTFIGDITQKAFVKDWMQHFGLMMQKKNYENTYEFKKRNDIIQDTTNAINISSKFDKQLSNVYALKSYAQKNRFGYNYKNPDSEKFADGFLEINNTTLPIELTHLMRPYNACETSESLLNSQLITSTPFWEAKRDDSGNITDWKVLKGKNYIGKVKRINETITYKTATGGDTTFTGSVARLSFVGMDYQTLINENYSKIKVVLDWNNIITANILFTKFDIKNLDFFKLYYIKQLASYFMINKVKYVGGKSKTELIKIS